MSQDNLPAAVWLDRLRLSTELHRDLATLVSYPNLAETKQLARHGSGAAIPLVTTAAFVNADVRELVLSAMRQIGDAAAPALVAILEQPLFEVYRGVWRQGGMADPGAASEARICSRYVYAISLESLADLVAQSHGMLAWFPAARAAALPYRTSGELILSGPARAVVDWVDREMGIASRISPARPWSQETPGAAGSDISATGWGRSEAEREYYVQEQAMRAQDEARRAEFAAAFWFMDQQRRNKRR